MEKRFCDRCEAVITGDYFGVKVFHFGIVMPASQMASPLEIIELKSDLCATCYQTAREVLTLVPAERTA